MAYTTKAATVGMLGADTSETLDAAKAATLVGKGMKFVVRYVAQSYMPPAQGISAAELAELTGAGLAVMLVQFGRSSGWSATTGSADGTAAAKNALAIGYPKSACLWLDLEGAIPSSAVAIAYVNAWYEAAAAAGMNAAALGVYVGPGVPLTPAELYEKLYVARYWKAGAIVPDVQSRGYQMMQLYPGNQTIAPGILIDYDVLQDDFFNSAPVLCVPA